MAHRHRSPRTTDTTDLSATVRLRGRSCLNARIVNLSASGMLVAARGAYPVAAIASVELDGPDFRYAGRAQVARRGDGVLGMRFLSWDGLAERSVRSLAAARLHRQQLASQPAGVDAPHATISPSHHHDAAAIAGTSAVHEGSLQAVPVLLRSDGEHHPCLKDAYVTDWSRG
jgi:hypothetical protein